MDILKNPKFAAVVAHYERACKAGRLHATEAKRALANYGDHGPARFPTEAEAKGLN